MSLNWDVTKVKNHDVVCFDTGEHEGRSLKVVTHCLIYATIGVGLRGITLANAEEFAARLNILQDLNGALMGNAEGEVRITREDVLAHVGLTTNVSDETRAKWLTRITKARFYRADQEAKAKVQARAHAKATADREALREKSRAAGHSVF